MKAVPAEEDINIDPSYFLSTLRRTLNANSDLALARVLEVLPSIISKIRNRHKVVGAPFLIRCHEVSGLSILELRRLLRTQQATSAESIPLRKQGQKSASA